jgi:hypothetical protein
MKIATLGISGSGKSTYTSGMAMKFYFGQANVNGYHIQDRTVEDEEDFGYEYRSFGALNTIIEKKEFPPSNPSTTRLRLMLYKGEEPILPIDWIDYRGGVLREFARNEVQEKDKQLYADLLDSSVIIVFTDAVLLKALMDKGANSITITPDIGANVISKVLRNVQKFRKSNGLGTRVMFILSKFDSSTIDQKRTFQNLRECLGRFMVYQYQKI